MTDRATSRASPPADTSLPDEGDVAERLLRYLQRATQDPTLAYAEAPARMTGGFEAAIFSFRLGVAPPPFAGPLVLRLFRPSRQPQAVRREAAVQNALADITYPAARVVMIETGPSLLGGPFLIMERLPGRQLGFGFEGQGQGRSANGLVRSLLGLPHGMRRVIAIWCQAQLGLHALPIETFAAALDAAEQARNSFSLDAQYSMMRQWIADARLDGLAPGMEWLLARRPAAAPPAICHGDLHPLNILVVGDTITGVVDWGSVAIADPALDLGTALAITATVPIPAPPALRPILRPILRGLGRAFARAYLRSRPLDEASLRYFQVYCCLRQLIWVGLGAAAGNPRVGAYGSPEGVRNLIRHIAAVAGVAVDLPVFGAESTASTAART
ncbi:MAG TPA: phosphotransferase [Stellaceae bacterium]|nr:phosphotransferase [Stellaceae bacterium]